MLVQIEPGYYIQKSKRKNKKYDIIKNGKYLLSFGSSLHSQWRDSTPLKAFKHLDHNDKERRGRYYQRHGRTDDKNSAKYFANKYLW